MTLTDSAVHTVELTDTAVHTVTLSDYLLGKEDELSIVNAYYVGQRVRLQGEFEVSDVDTDPTAIVMKHRDASGNIATLAIGDLVKSATGIYYLDVDLDEAGDWYYRFAGSGVYAAGEKQLRVLASQF